MSNQYATGLPFDRNGTPMQHFAVPKPALATSAADNLSTSSLITLTPNTTTVEVGASGAGAVIKWFGATASLTAPYGSVINAAGTANFDNFVAANTVRRFVVPQSVIGVSSIVGANPQNGLYPAMAVKSTGVGSVLTTQY